MGTSKAGCQIIAQVLELTETEAVFGLLFEKEVPVYEELHRTDIRCILMRHGQGVVHAADGYARATGKTGVCLLHSFLGTVNAITGIATAYRDSIPLVILITDVFSGCENEIANMTSPCTKHTFIVREINLLPKILRVAFWMAASGRPGPVAVVFPKEILKEKGEFFWPEKIQVPWKIVYTQILLR